MHGPQAKPSLLWWVLLISALSRVAPPAHSPTALRPKLGLRIQLIGHLIPLTAPLRLWEQREKHEAYHFFFYKPITALAASSSGSSESVRNDPQQAMDTILWHLHRNCRCSTPGLFCPITWPALCTGLVQSLDTASSLNTPQLAFQSRARTLLPDPP
jgi:hypothetical protein